MNWLATYNHEGSIPIADIPLVSYPEFHDSLVRRLGDPVCHVVNYFGVAEEAGLRFYCLLADDKLHTVDICSFLYGYYEYEPLQSAAAVRAELHPYEREITERFGIRFEGEPWPKPLRYPFDRFHKDNSIDEYPFYSMSGDALHEVNVGPIHAGIIEPGAFRFICNGEKVLHLEISLGYQHRGIEHLILNTSNRLRQTVLCESVAGDTAVGHSTAYVTAVEKLYRGQSVTDRLQYERVIALELERIAMHIADTGALCMDIGYQLGQVACEALRTIVINTTQSWCGNRFGKGLVRPGGSRYPLKADTAVNVRANLAEVVRRYNEVREDLKSAPSLLARFEDCGNVSREQMHTIGAVGMAARASGLVRDIRASHPYGPWSGHVGFAPEYKRQGDVMARLMLRGRELFASAGYIDQMLDAIAGMPEESPGPKYNEPLAADSLAYSLVDGWRGEICHCAVTDKEGRLVTYKIKDPSVHNWLALALAMRGEGISDFPINNKSFNLSYCGHDL